MESIAHLLALKRIAASAIWILAATTFVGCSDGTAPTAPIQISKAEMDQSEISRAKLILDGIERLPASQRQAAAAIPRSATTLKNASRIDPACARRIQSLDLHLN